MSLKKYPLAKQISYTSATLIGLIFLILIASAGWYTAWATRQSTEAAIQGQASVLANKLEIAHELSKESTSRLSDLFHSSFKGDLQINTAQMVNLPGTQAPMLTLNGQPITNQFNLVDQFTSSTGGVATVFVKTGEDYVRVSTSVKKENGERALGTKLDRKHPAYPKLLNGETYTGEAKLFGTHYMTQYVPVRSASGQMDVVLFVGFNIERLFAKLQDTVLKTAVGKGGVPFALRTSGDKAGQVLIHSQLKDQDWNTLAKEQPALQSLLADAVQTPQGITEVSWVNQAGAKQNELVAHASTSSWGGVTLFAPIPMAELYARVYEVVGMLVVVGVLAALALALSMARMAGRITQPTKGLTQLALRLGNGDLTARADESLTLNGQDTKNEMNLLARSMNRMAESMESALYSVKANSERVQWASEQLVGSSHDLEQGAAQESDAASGMASAVEEMGSSIASVGESAAHTKQISLNAKRLADEGLGAITSATEQMNRISHTVMSTSDVISQLGDQSRQISEIALIIKGIAEQTNLLALNAAIEAARAGEMGRGFSVVADEVRKLAERTRVSTDSIHGMIEAIQQSSDVAVHNMSEAVDSVKLGVDLVERAGEAMQQITQESQAVAGAILNIDEALGQQNVASQSIGHKVELVAELSERNLSVARQAASAVGDLQGVASELSGMVKRFQVSDTSMPRS